MTEPTLDELLASRATLNRQIAALELGPIKEAQAELTKTSTGNTLSKLRAIVSALPNSPARDQIQNVVTVLEKVPEYLGQVLPELEALATPPPEDAAEDPASEDLG